jgi:hypothetical protein
MVFDFSPLATKVSFERKVHIHPTGIAAEILNDPETVSGDPLLKGFVLQVRALWD